MADAVELKVDGLREFITHLRAIDRDLPKAVRIAFNEAADIVIADAKPRVPRLSGAAQGSIKAASTRTKARVKGGGSRTPYYPWLDFGGQIGRLSGNAVGDRGRRPFLPRGRYIYKAFFQNRERFVDAMSKAIVKVARQAGIEVTSGG